MAHNLSNDTMVYAGSEPWHRLGIRLPAVFTAADALKYAGFDYIVNQENIMVQGKVIESHKANVRSDNGDVLGIVGNRYKILQNREAFSFFDVLAGEGKAIFETAGALGRGEKIWIMARCDAAFEILPGDTINPYLLLINSRDGSSPGQVMFTGIRVVCQNTLNAAMGATTRRAVTVRHTGDVEGKLRFAAELMKEAEAYFFLQGETFKKFAQISLTDAEIAHFMGAVFGQVSEAGSKRVATMREEHIDSMTKLAATGRGSDIKGVRGTLWAAYNAATEYVDHIRDTKGDDSDRTQSILFGQGSKLKQKAFDVAVALMKN